MLMIELLFCGKYSIPILKIIVLKKDCNITEIAKSLDLSKSIVLDTIKRLEKENVIISSKKGKRNYYNLNTDNFFVREYTKNIFNFEKKMISEVKNKIIKELSKLKPLSIILYGSFDTPKFNFKSDIDIAVIAKNKQKAGRKIEKINKDLSKIGLIIFIDIMDKKELIKMHKIKEPLIENLIRNGVVLYGKHPLEMSK